MTASRISPLLYFGKVPSRGDFLRSAQGGALISSLDRWLTGGIEAMATDARWKMVYDRAAAVHFAFLGNCSPVGLAGHLLASADASGRRFPFITAHTLEVRNPLPFLARSPLALARHWQRLESAACRVHGAGDAGAVLGELTLAPADVSTSWTDYEAPFRDFLDMHTVGSVEALLRDAGHAVSLPGLMLGLGLLLQPVLSHASGRLQKGLSLPLPRDPLYRPLVAALWLELVGGFLSNADFELALFLPQQLGAAPVLALGFDGASARSLHALLDPEVGRKVYIDTCETEWVGDQLGNEPALQKLSSYLQQRGLSMNQAANTFKEVFLGS